MVNPRLVSGHDPVANVDRRVVEKSQASASSKFGREDRDDLFVTAKPRYFSIYCLNDRRS